MIQLDDIRRARETIAGRLHRTPLMGSRYFSDRLGCDFHFKLESFQKTGSFKTRGALNKMESLGEAERARGVIGLSSGNHAQAVGYTAALAGVAAVVVMPNWSTDFKVAATRGYGAEVILTDRSILEVTQEVQAERDLTLVHPFDDPAIIAGAGTVGLEILDDLPEVDVVIAGIGGGGLISGVAAAIKLARPEAKVYGAEPEGACAMTLSLAEGHPVQLDKIDTVADGLAAPFAGEHTLEHVRQFVDRVVTVTDAEILEAMRPVIERGKFVVEPSATAGLAALLTGKIEIPPGAKVACILSGGNVNCERLKTLI